MSRADAYTASLSKHAKHPLQSGANLERKNPDVRARIQELKGIAPAEMRANRIRDREYIMQKLDEVLRKCMKPQSIKDRHGNSTGETRIDATGALKAIELAGREQGMFERTTNHRKLEDPLAGLTPDKARTLIASAFDKLNPVKAEVIDVECVDGRGSAASSEGESDLQASGVRALREATPVPQPGGEEA